MPKTLIAAIVATGLVINGGLGMGGAAAQEPVVAMLGHPVQHPTGGYSLVWNGSTIDVRMPGGSAQYLVANMQRQVWVQLIVENQRLPISVFFDGGTLLVAWSEPAKDLSGRIYKEYYDNYWGKLGY